MEYPIIVNGETLKVESEKELPIESQQQLYQLVNVFYDYKQKVDEVTFEYDSAKDNITKGFAIANEEFGFKKVRTKYCSICFVPSKEETIEQVKVLNEKRVLNYLREIGVDESTIQQFYDTKAKVSNKRKASIRVTE